MRWWRKATNRGDCVIKRRLWPLLRRSKYAIHECVEREGGFERSSSWVWGRSSPRRNPPIQGRLGKRP